MEQKKLVELTADIVAAHVSNNSVPVRDLATVIQDVHFALRGIATGAPGAETIEPAVSIRASVKPDSLTCLVCGKTQKTLKRHLGSAHDMTPAEYRETFNLKGDYPLVAPNYSKRRSEMAKSIGLGKRPKSASSKASANPTSRAKPGAKGSASKKSS